MLLSIQFKPQAIQSLVKKQNSHLIYIANAGEVPVTADVA